MLNDTTVVVENSFWPCQKCQNKTRWTNYFPVTFPATDTPPSTPPCLTCTCTAPSPAFPPTSPSFSISSPIEDTPPRYRLQRRFTPPDPRAIHFTQNFDDPPNSPNFNTRYKLDVPHHLQLECEPKISPSILPCKRTATPNTPVRNTRHCLLNSSNEYNEQLTSHKPTFPTLSDSISFDDDLHSYDEGNLELHDCNYDEENNYNETESYFSDSKEDLAESYTLETLYRQLTVPSESKHKRDLVCLTNLPPGIPAFSLIALATTAARQLTTPRFKFLKNTNQFDPWRLLATYFVNFRDDISLSSQLRRDLRNFHKLLTTISILCAHVLNCNDPSLDNTTDNIWRTFDIINFQAHRTSQFICRCQHSALRTIQMHQFIQRLSIIRITSQEPINCIESLSTRAYETCLIKFHANSPSANITLPPWASACLLNDIPCTWSTFTEYLGKLSEDDKDEIESIVSSEIITLSSSTTCKYQRWYNGVTHNTMHAYPCAPETTHKRFLHSQLTARYELHNRLTGDDFPNDSGISLPPLPPAMFFNNKYSSAFFVITEPSRSQELEVWMNIDKNSDDIENMAFINTVLCPPMTHECARDLYCSTSEYSTSVTSHLAPYRANMINNHLDFAPNSVYHCLDYTVCHHLHQLPQLVIASASDAMTGVPFIIYNPANWIRQEPTSRREYYSMFIDDKATRDPFLFPQYLETDMSDGQEIPVLTDEHLQPQSIDSVRKQFQIGHIVPLSTIFTEPCDVFASDINNYIAICNQYDDPKHHPNTFDLCHILLPNEIPPYDVFTRLCIGIGMKTSPKGLTPTNQTSFELVYYLPFITDCANLYLNDYSVFHIRKVHPEYEHHEDPDFLQLDRPKKSHPIVECPSMITMLLSLHHLICDNDASSSHIPIQRRKFDSSPYNCKYNILTKHTAAKVNKNQSSNPSIKSRDWINCTINNSATIIHHTLDSIKNIDIEKHVAFVVTTRRQSKSS